MKVTEKEIAIDGKTICSTSKMKEYEKPMHIVTALLVDNTVSLGQKIIDNGGDYVLQLKSNKGDFTKKYMQCLMINIWM